MTTGSEGLDLAERVLRGVRDEAVPRGVAVAAAAEDLGGQIVAAARMDGSQLVSMPLAVDKAFTAAAAGVPTSQWAERAKPGAQQCGLHTVLGGRFIVSAEACRSWPKGGWSAAWE